MRIRIVLLIAFLSIGDLAIAQLKDERQSFQLKKTQGRTICYYHSNSSELVIPPPAAYENWKQHLTAKTNTTTFEVRYVNFPDNAKAAFQKAVAIWSSIIESSVPIRITAEWEPLENGVLGGANFGFITQNFNGAPRINTWYPIALAEKLASHELNGVTDPDIIASFNSSFTNWSFSTSGTPQAGQTDFVSVVLHEIGHGLGFVDSYGVATTGQGIIDNFFQGSHITYDHYLENGTDANLVQNFTPNTSTLGTELKSNNLFFRSSQLQKTTIDNRARIYAPANFQAGSSIAHLDLLYDGTINALMTPSIGPTEILYNPGPLAMRMLADMGWVNTQIIHASLRSTENVSTSFPVVVTLKADTKNQDGGLYAYKADEVKLNYTSDGITFTEVSMNPTGQLNQFSAEIPATGNPINYGYFITVKDNLDRTLVRPGISTEDGATPIQNLFVFEVGPDTKAPFLSHSPIDFAITSNPQLEIEAVASDNIAVSSVFLDYKITKSGVTGSLLTLPMNLVAGTDSTYSQTIPYSGLGLSNGDKIEYRIRAIDQANVPNTKSIPIGAPGFYNVNIVSLAPTQDSYSNDFNNISVASQDFFGSPEFSIRTEAGFTNGAIHTNHPYPEGQGFPNNRFEWVYQLRVPIRVKETEATIKFDEVVLVEPGTTGAPFPSEDFFDYVVVDGSKDGGVTWTTIADGYDSRDFSPWLTRYNSATSGSNSTAVGDQNLFRTRIMNLQDKFDTGDEVVIRFRLFSDPGAAGWGWAIDNLKIQIDETSPTILHDHIDYLLAGATGFSITIRPSDASGLDRIFIDTKVNGGNDQTIEIIADENIGEYIRLLTFIGINVGGKVEYRIRAKDLIGNEAVLPANGYFQVPIISFSTPVAQYVTDFNSTNTDFVGNFFSITQPSGFTNNAMHTQHPYPNGFGLTNTTSDYVLTLTKPVTVSTTNSYLLFSEIALVEYTGISNKDFVVVEGSKDGGQTWNELVGPYSAKSVAAWKSIFDVGGSGTTSLYRSRLIDITGSGDFEAGDNVLFRFRISADATGNGWGWAMDNLSIQGPITGVKEALDLFVSVYPNPVNGDVFTLEVKGLSAHSGQVQITNLQGQQLLSESVSLTESITRKEYSTTNWADGIYVVRLNLEDGSTVTKKLIKASH
jgi:Secretion system C-terminal sorting domain